MTAPAIGALKRLARAWTPPILADALRSALKPAPPRYDGVVTFACQGLTWRLDARSSIARQMLVTGVWEPATTALVADLVKEGMQTLSVGANFGYYALLMARQVGPAGHVWAFEPTACYRAMLDAHLAMNGLADRVTVVPFGLSDAAARATIDISPQSASMHYGPQETRLGQEEIELRRLDDVAAELGIQRVDFVSIDIDGHEPAFLRGADKTLRRDLPPIAMEFAQECLHYAGSDVREVASLLVDIGYQICSETTREPFPSEHAFLKECGNFSHYANALAVRRPSGAAGFA
jgi:FkbM family methyltransferase